MVSQYIRTLNFHQIGSYSFGLEQYLNLDKALPLLCNIYVWTLY